MKKSAELEMEESEHKLKKELGLGEMIVFTMGAVLGTGIFVMPALVASIAGSASIWLWLEVGLLTIFMALCMAEMASIHPHAGGPYKFVREAFGRLPGFLSGWLGWLITWFTIATLAAAASFYISYFIPMSIVSRVLVAVFLLMFMTMINYSGVKYGAKVQMVFTVATILILWTFVTWGIYHVKISYFVPTQIITIPALIAASVLVIEPFIGWETATYLSEECKNPTRDVPLAIIITSVLVVILYTAVAFVTLGVIRAEHLQTSVYPLATAGRAFLGSYGGALMALGTIVVLIGCLNSWIVTGARLPYALARDNLFPKHFSAVHKIHKIPHKSLLFQFAFASIAVVLGNFQQLIYILVTLAMILYILVFFSLIVHRGRGVKAPFKVPLGYVVSTIAIFTAFFVVFNVEPLFTLVGVTLTLVGLPFYYYMTYQVKPSMGGKE